MLPSSLAISNAPPLPTAASSNQPVGRVEFSPLCNVYGKSDSFWIVVLEDASILQDQAVRHEIRELQRELHANSNDGTMTATFDEAPLTMQSAMALLHANLWSSWRAAEAIVMAFLRSNLEYNSSKWRNASGFDQTARCIGGRVGGWVGKWASGQCGLYLMCRESFCPWAL